MQKHLIKLQKRSRSDPPQKLHTHLARTHKKEKLVHEGYYQKKIKLHELFLVGVSWTHGGQYNV